MAAMTESRPLVSRLPVRGASPYDVVVGHGVLDEVAGMLGDGAQRVAVCFAEPLAGLAARVVAVLGDREVLRIPLPDGEVAKTGPVAIEAWERLGEAGFTRSDVVVTVGGKTGMNTGAGKNLVGAFHEPAGVVCDLDLLGTLPEPELIAGLGEVVKCGFIADPEILALVERCPADALEPRSGELRELVERAIAVKIAVVQDDLKETGPGNGTAGIGREVLNYGHTMAHAIERATGYRVRHGEAVSLGMVYVAELARLAGRLGDEDAERHETVLSSVGLPTRFTGAPFEELLATMRVDKKSRGSQLRFVVLEGIGRPAILADPSDDLLRAAYEHLGGSR
jgi:3-dehydroquinate synthase